jgi:hypothetical protein
MANPGSHYVVGHAARMKARREVYGLPRQVIEQNLARGMTSRCERCGWHSAKGEAASAAIRGFKSHSCLAETVLVTA